MAACTKGADSKVLTEQYNSSIKAKPRAYSFKQSFMTYLYRNLVHNLAPYSPLISEEEWMKNPLEEIYKEKMSVYHGLTQNQLCRRFGISSKAKQLNFMLCQKMLGISGCSKATTEMEVAGIIFRTITIDKNGKPTESMPFKSFEFEELINTPWDESVIRDDFVDLKLMIFVFKEINGVISFDRIHFWNAPNSVVDGDIKKCMKNAQKWFAMEQLFILTKKVKLKINFLKKIETQMEYVM